MALVAQLGATKPSAKDAPLSKGAPGTADAVEDWAGAGSTPTAAAAAAATTSAALAGAQESRAARLPRASVTGGGGGGGGGRLDGEAVDDARFPSRPASGRSRRASVPGDDWTWEDSSSVFFFNEPFLVTLVLAAGMLFGLLTVYQIRILELSGNL